MEEFEQQAQRAMELSTFISDAYKRYPIGRLRQMKFWMGQMKVDFGCLLEDLYKTKMWDGSNEPTL